MTVTYAASSGTVTVNVGTTDDHDYHDHRLEYEPDRRLNRHLHRQPEGGQHRTVKAGQDLAHHERRIDVRTARSTTVNGVYTFTQAFGSTGQRVYHAEFAGDSTYAASSGTVTVNVGLTTTTTTTITASNTNPPSAKPSPSPST